MIKDEYSPYKIIHHDHILKEMREGRQPAPIQVHLIPTNKCNQSCSFCAYRIPEYSSNQNFSDQDVMPGEKLLETINSCAALGVKAIQYTGGGEPLMHPKIKEAFRLTRDLGLEMALVSNGMALDEELIDFLADVSWVRISVDSYKRETYSLLRRVRHSVYDKVINNIQRLAQTTRSVTLGVGFVVNAENHMEIYDACKLFKELGVDNFRISAAFTPAGVHYFDAFYDQAKDLAAAAKHDFEDDRYTVFNLFNDRIGDLFSGTQDYDFCPVKELVPYIAADMNVYTCCVLAYNDNGYIGSIRDVRFDELWYGEKKTSFYAQHSPRELCQLPCMFKNKNDFINYCIKKSPKHTHFI